MDAAPRADRQERIVWSIILAACVAMLMIAAWIEPDPSGHGTHEQLGFPPCGFVEMFDAPCPSCGYTTTFAYAVRLRWWRALTNQPFGFIVFLLTLVGIPTAIRVVFRGWSILYASRNWPWARIIIVGLALWLGAWGYKWMTWTPTGLSRNEEGLVDRAMSK